MFINDVLDGCENYGIDLEPGKCCGGLFADDIVLVAPSKKNLKKILNKVHNWAIRNEMTFGINKCATLVIKPINFNTLVNYFDLSFFFGINKILKCNKCFYLGIPFDNTLSLDVILSHYNEFNFKFVFPLYYK